MSVPGELLQLREPALGPAVDLSRTASIHPHATEMQMTAPRRWVLLMGTARPGAERRVSGPGSKGTGRNELSGVTEAETSAKLLHLIPWQHRDRLVLRWDVTAARPLLGKFILN